MGFQQKILDHIFIAFLTSISSLLVALLATIVSLYFLALGLAINVLGAMIIFILCYKHYYLKKFYPIPLAHALIWLLVLTLTFSFAFSLPIIARESLIQQNLKIYGTLLPLIAFIGFEIYSFKNSLHHHIFKS